MDSKMRDRSEVEWAKEGFRLGVEMVRKGYGTPEDLCYNQMVMEALDWALGNNPEKFCRVIRDLRELYDSIKADQN